VVVTFFAYRFVPKLMRKPWAGEEFGTHPSEMSARTLAGRGDLRHRLGIVRRVSRARDRGAGHGNWPLLVSLAGLAAGAFVQGRFFTTGKP
jgi:hypothetical protein